MATALATAAARRAGPGLAVTADAGRIARAAHAMAARFQRGGRLLTFGIGLAAADAAHVAVEFAHPAMAGRRALPAIPLAADACALTASGGNGSGPLTAQLRMLGRPHDIALGILGPGRPDGDVPAALAAHLLAARSGDPLIVREIHLTIAHLLWELVHAFMEQPDLLVVEAPR